MAVRIIRYILIITLDESVRIIYFRTVDRVYILINNRLDAH